MPSANRDPFESQNPYEAALEGSCDALITLQLVSASIAGSCAENKAFERQGARAIDALCLTIKSLRGAIEELRLAQNEARNALALGFVLGDRCRGTRRRSRS